jgi:23S rRNA (guanine1835-N2)-methyltransferase
MLHLKRYPLRKNELLQAWDSADELILQHISQFDLVNKRILIINDHFGALSSCLKDFKPTIYVDSFISHEAIRYNTHNEILPIYDLGELSGIYDYVLIQLPKNLSYFEDILCHISHHLHPQSQLIAGYMIKHLSPTWFDLLNRYIGATTTTLAQKKARLILAQFEKSPVNSPYPLEVTLDSFQHKFVNHSNVFSREKLDIGTRFFLEHIPTGHFSTILDLGCANGVVGIRAKELNPNAHIIFSDESAMAIKSAQVNFNRFFQAQADFIWTNCYEKQKQDSLDLVLCNPPFHQNQTIGDFIAIQMFQDAFDCLKKGGIMRVIGNSHLAYQVKLKKIFGNSQIVATNKKFMIVDAIK